MKLRSLVGLLVGFLMLGVLLGPGRAFRVVFLGDPLVDLYPGTGRSYQWGVLP